MSTSGSALAERVDHPGPNDVLMGRGAPVSEHEGNTRLRSIVIERHADYVAPTNKRQEKHLVALEIIERVQQEGGRFLRRQSEEESEGGNESSTNSATSWIVVRSQTDIIRKVKQLLRDMGPEARERRAERHRLRTKNPHKLSPTKQATPSEQSSKSATRQSEPEYSTSSNPESMSSPPSVPTISAHQLASAVQSLPSQQALSLPALPMLRSGLDGLRAANDAALLAALRRRQNISLSLSQDPASLTTLAALGLQSDFSRPVDHTAGLSLSRSSLTNESLESLLRIRAEQAYASLPIASPLSSLSHRNAVSASETIETAMNLLRGHHSMTASRNYPNTSVQALLQSMLPSQHQNDLLRGTFDNFDKSQGRHG